MGCAGRDFVLYIILDEEPSSIAICIPNIK